MALRSPQVFSVYNLIDLDVVNRGKQAFEHLEKTLTRAKPVAIMISSILTLTKCISEMIISLRG